MTDSQGLLGERETATLIEGRERFLRFLRGKINDPNLAEDILQDSLLKAVRSGPQLRASDGLMPWFYAILRNAVVDVYRRENRAISVDIDAIDLPDETEEERKKACACFVALLPTLRGDYAELISALDLDNEPPATVAERLGITANNLKVRHYRARQALRLRLEATCRVCAEHRCLDCTCQAMPPEV